MPIPCPTCLNSVSVSRLVNPRPSPVNAAATIDPLNIDSPTTRRANSFAVEPIPTPPVPSTENCVLPDPTRSVLLPFVVVPILGVYH